jgi:hypothetical protein
MLYRSLVVGLLGAIVLHLAALSTRPAPPPAPSPAPAPATLTLSRTALENAHEPLELTLDDGRTLFVHVTR